MQGDRGFGNYSRYNGDIQRIEGDKFVQYSANQVTIFEKYFVECQKPSHAMRIAMIRENSVLSNLNSQQIQAWFENRRFLEKKKKDAFVCNLLNEKMGAIGRLLRLENNLLYGEVQQSLREKELHLNLIDSEAPRSVFESLKTFATNRLLLLENDCLHHEVQQLHKEREYIQNLQENLSNSESIVNSYRSWSAAARSSKGLPLRCGTIAKFPSKTPDELNCVSIPRMKFFGGLREIPVNTCSDLTYFSVNGNINDVSVMLSFVKAAMVQDGPLDNFLHKHQELILCYSLEDIKLVLHGSGESLTAVVPAFLPQGFRVVVGRYCVSGAWSYFPNEQAGLGDVKFVLRVKRVN